MEPLGQNARGFLLARRCADESPLLAIADIGPCTVPSALRCKADITLAACRAFSGRYWGQSGHGLVRCTCLLLGGTAGTRGAERKQSTSKLSKQSIRALEIPRVKAFRKVAISGTKDFERFGAHALIHPEPGQVGCRAKFK